MIGNTGTYLMTNGTGVAPGYAEKKGFYPVETGHLEILVTPRRYRESGKDQVWFEIQVVE